jgi:adenylate kinase family enzyme
VVLERFKIYQRATRPLVEFYRDRPTFRSIDGAQTADSVTADLAAAIEAVGNGRLNAASGGSTR